MPVRIVVDERERRSRIPGLLRQAGAVTDFAHLKVGDYVISSETAIERKTIHDLLNSVYDGRLLVQCSELVQHYTKPVIIIEGNILNLSDGAGAAVEDILDDNERIYLINETLAKVALDFRIPIINTPYAEYTSQLLVTMVNRALEGGANKGPLLKRIKKTNPVQIQQLSILSSLPGVGDKLAVRMLERFLTPRRALTASAAELARLPGFGTARALKVRKILDSHDYKSVEPAQRSLLDAES
ncbi:MAG: heavy metal resistance protein CzcA [Candidatus Nitrosopolaris wilkensis]|nr:MAG: heavy metal resistance protein CzcA [Candidatus Nitrosopolaris wilkensis]